MTLLIFWEKGWQPVGTGSSVIPSMLIIAEQAEQLTVFKRTATYSAPARKQLADKDEVQKIKGNYLDLREKA